MSWKIIDQRTGRRATIGSFFTREQAERQIENWIARHHRGGRPDITMDMLENLAPAEEDSQW